jgi:hypothetical protein
MAICGPSNQAEANAAAASNFYSAMTGQQLQTFGQQQDLLNQIKAVTAPILAAGPQQYGFTPDQEKVLEGAITEQGAKATSDVVNATQLAERQKTGGTNLMPSGASTQIEENARIIGAQDTAGRLANLKLTGYERGNQLYTQALGALGGVANLQSPTAYAGSATNAGDAATKGIQLADSERSNLLQTILGGAVQGGLDIGTAGAMKALKI